MRSRSFTCSFVLGVAAAALLSQNATAQESEVKDGEEVKCWVTLRVEFLKTGETGKIERLKTTCEGGEWGEAEQWWKKAEGAARKLVFTPASRKGRPVTVTKTVDFSFERLDDPEEPPDPVPADEGRDPITERELTILEKPEARYPPGSGNICVRGTVILRVTFLADGNIGPVFVVKGLPYGLTDKAVEAAAGISFIPKEVDGVPVTVNKTVHYNFSIY